MWKKNPIGNVIYQWPYLLIEQPFIPQLEFRLSCSCLDDHQIPPVIDKAIAFDTGTYFHQLRVKFSELCPGKSSPT